ncbi:NAD-dependent epimerase/dehydratase family protein [Chitinophaga sp. G-6-1-13]|uniref:NAD-dependent epimerase/dehydratase family protein n=1 Tax=Chitinophaga fulva TaxID=2728842 RepID=A0A848GQG5_9BACT|nr:NAD-dependent epimerase/dehydratase family protein [Chitinophaga fulva]NML38128.1 NAD-dependent epimerase/dehydratase family protein [Chitinophaga fulva]
MDTKRVFILGTTGYIGGSLAIHLQQQGYEIYSRVRRETDIPRLKALGITATAGLMTGDPAFTAELQAADIVINVASSDDPFLVTTILEALEGSGKMYIHTSGGGILGDKAAGQHANSNTYTDIIEKPLLERAGRVLIDQEVMNYAQKGVHTIVICPTMVYGKGLALKQESDQIPTLIREAQQRGQSVMVGKGVHLTSNVHIMDLLSLYELAISKAPAGSFYYAENGLTSFKAIAEQISHSLGLQKEVLSISIGEAIEIWGPVMAHFGLGSNIVASATKARQELGWQPVHNSLLEEIDKTY